MKVTLLGGPANGQELVWPSLGYTPAPHAFIPLEPSHLQGRDGSTCTAIYELDLGGRSATFLGIRRRS